MKMLKLICKILNLILLSIVSGNVEAQLKVDPKYQPYEPVLGVSGRISSVGSDTMGNLMALWGEGFKSNYPHIAIEISSKGSSTAPPVLINGAANFCPMSRKLKSKEIDRFQGTYGYEPTQFPVAIDMVSIFVNKDNPLEGIYLHQLDAVFSKNRKSGFPYNIYNWSNLGLKGRWKNKPIVIYGRNAASGTYGYFKHFALYDGDYKDGVNEEPGSSSAVQGITRDLYGIGYCGIGYRTDDVRPLPLAEKVGEPFIEPIPENAYSGKYPLTRYLWLTLNIQPNQSLDPLRGEFIKYILSKDGQHDVLKGGYLPLPYTVAKSTLESLSLKWP